MFSRGTPKRHGYGELFADWEIDTARYMARWAFHRFPSLQSLYELEDLTQVSLIHWLGVRERYQEDRGASRQTYMGKVIRNRMLELVRSENTDIRRANAAAEPLSRFVDSEDAAPSVDLEDRSIRPDDFELRERLEIATSQLTDRQKRILDLYADESIAAIARDLDICRSTVYEEVERIRKVFEDCGLKDFLK